MQFIFIWFGTSEQTSRLKEISGDITMGILKIVGSRSKKLFLKNKSLSSTQIAELNKIK